MAHGVRIFRVDNPHTKPLAFWERLLGEIHATDPDVLFLAEAFTRPAMMHALAKVGFHQSYTYFTWRNHAEELERVPAASCPAQAAAYMRPNFFANTPDILHEYLQHGGPAAFKIRAVLAAMLSPTWGVYSGLRAVREHPGAARQRGVHGFGEVPVPAAGLGAGRAGEPRHRAVHRRAQQNPRKLTQHSTGCVIYAFTLSISRTGSLSPSASPRRRRASGRQDGARSDTVLSS